MARRTDDKSECDEKIQETVEPAETSEATEVAEAEEAALEEAKATKSLEEAEAVEEAAKTAAKALEEAEAAKAVEEAAKTAASKALEEAAKAVEEAAAAEAAKAAEAAALQLNRLSIVSSQKKLLVLNINGLLAHCFFKNDNNVTVPRSRNPDGVFNQRLVFKRPYCDEFLQFCFERFEVAIWSSAMKRNVDGYISYVVGAFKDRLLFIWDQSDCTDSGFMTIENNNKPIFLKELKKIWGGRYLRCHGKTFSSSNTLLIDDAPNKALLNPPNTGVFPDPYKVEQTWDFSLGANGDIRRFLKGLAAADEVPSYVAAHPFGQPVITSKHPDWKFYSKIISHRSAVG